MTKFFLRCKIDWYLIRFPLKMILIYLTGCAMFWSLRSFEKDSSKQDFALRELFAPDEGKFDCRWKSMQDIHDLLDCNPELKEITRTKVGQVLQVATLKPRNRKAGDPDRIVVGNTHLFYHPMADHIRVMQAYVTCRKLDQVRREVSSGPCPLVLCGDLNSDPLSGTLCLLLNHKVDASHYETWKNLKEYSWDKGEHDFLMEHGFIGNDDNMTSDPLYVDEAFEDAVERPFAEEVQSNTSPPTICLPSCFPKLTSGYQEIPEFTNFAVDFAETLDYILLSQPDAEVGVGMEVIDAAPVFHRTDMEKYVAMPNQYMPSDHISMLCDVKWTNQAK
jgi:mRNA deadenylase 3'-5' endonuclease subunit Ccr4